MLKTIYSLNDRSDLIDWNKVRNHYEQIILELDSTEYSETEGHESFSLRGSDNKWSADHKHRKLALVDGDVFDGYEYSKENCQSSDSGVPCPPENLDRLCNKYDVLGSMRDCVEACEPAICCIHAAPPSTNDVAPNCNSDQNCARYNYCYIAWWKLHDTVGPHSFLRVEQTDDFYDVTDNEFRPNAIENPFFGQLFYHHWDNIEPIIDAGTTSGGNFNADLIFTNPEFWDPA